MKDTKVFQKNEKAIKEYIQNQLQEYKLAE